MPKHCEICGKTALRSAKRSFSNKATICKQQPNLHSIKILVNGVAKKARVCTSCIRANKVQTAV